MDAINAIMTRRTIRRFRQDNIDIKTLEALVTAARMAPQGGNVQPMKYCIVSEPELVKKMFACVGWAAYLAPNGAPGPDNEPVAFIAMLCDKTIKENCDVDAGAAGATICLAAHALGLGCCWMGSVNRAEAAKIIGMPEGYTLHGVFALGYPDESPVSEEAKGSIKYYKDEKGTLHVPKRPLGEILFYNKIG